MHNQCISTPPILFLHIVEELTIHQTCSELVARLKELINHFFSGITPLFQDQSFMQFSVFTYLVDHSLNSTFLIETNLFAGKGEVVMKLYRHGWEPGKTQSGYKIVQNRFVFSRCHFFPWRSWGMRGKISKARLLHLMVLRPLHWNASWNPWRALIRWYKKLLV